MTTVELRPHPAKFSDAILEVLQRVLEDEAERHQRHLRVLDPMAGTGRIHELVGPWTTVGVEIEPEWAAYHRRTLVGDATALPFPDHAFEVAMSSPAYGNRMADTHNARDVYKTGPRAGQLTDRITYRHKLGRRLSPGNGGGLQWGCVSPGTRVLRADFRWVPAELLVAGDSVLGCDETVPGESLAMRQRGRRWRMGVVEAVAPDMAECVEVTFDDGLTMVVTRDHPFLGRNPTGPAYKRWIPAQDLVPGSSLGHYLPVWEEDRSYEGGWLAGILDGEGSYSLKNERSGRLAVAQNPGLVLDEIIRLLKSRNVDVHSHLNRDGTVTLTIRGGLAAQLSLLGSVRPERLLAKIRLDGHYMRAVGERRVVAVIPRGRREIVRLATSCRTYMTEGLVSHNSTYRETHLRILAEMVRVTAPGGLVVINVSNHIRNRREVDVAGWWHGAMKLTGLLVPEQDIKVPTPRMRYGQNHGARVEHEWVFVMRRRGR
ncbi:MAG: hypothetical protein M0010_12235 [Actinomycetota bacterium]|nr:hypothetical protein [Actinomycetota bacterium]